MAIAKVNQNMPKFPCQTTQALFMLLNGEKGVKNAVAVESELLNQVLWSFFDESILDPE